MLFIKKWIWAKKAKEFEDGKKTLETLKNRYVGWSAVRGIYPGHIIERYNEILTEATTLYDADEGAFISEDFKRALNTIDKAIVSLDAQKDIYSKAIITLGGISI